MRKIILPFLLLAGNICVAQLPVQSKMPTAFDKFILKNKIEWAAYISDTIRFTANNLSSILRDRFDKTEIKVSLPVTPRTSAANKINYSNKEAVFAALPPDVFFDYLAANLVDVVEILFVKNHRLRSYVPWVSPKYSVITPGGTRLGFADYFSTSFNHKYNASPASAGKNIFLGTTSRKFSIDSLPADNQLKSLFGKNLLESLWPSVIKEKLTLFVIDQDRTVSVAGLDTSFVFDKVSVPVYDSAGNPTATKTMYSQKVYPAMFKQIDLIQKWYYDRKKNMVYSVIPEIILYAGFSEYGVPGSEPKAILKIIF